MATSDHQQPLPVVRIGEIPLEDTASRWLVDGLWGESSVGVIATFDEEFLSRIVDPHTGKTVAEVVCSQLALSY